MTLTNSIPASADWVHQRNPIHCRGQVVHAADDPHRERCAMRLDTIELIGPGPHNLAEEALDVLSGERAMGDWVLEVRDHRVGGGQAPTPTSSRCSYQLVRQDHGQRGRGH